MTSMHEWDASADHLADVVLNYATERLRTPKDPTWGAQGASELHALLGHAISADGIGGDAALALVVDVIVPSCRPIDDPLHLAYVGTAPSIAANLFDLVVSASSIFAGMWEAGAGAIAAENDALAWLAQCAGFPSTAGGTFVSGGSAANLSALVTARAAHRERHGASGRRLAFAATTEVHSSVRATANVMDVDIVEVSVDDIGRMTGAALTAALLSSEREVFAVVASAGTTNAGAIDCLDEIATVCTRNNLWLHVDGAYGLAAIASPNGRRKFPGLERADSFGVDPHKWLFAPFDCAALVYRDPSVAHRTHAQHGAYLDQINRDEWNPSDYAYHLSRRARGLPLWFSLATYGTDAYAEAIDATLDVTVAFAEAIRSHDAFELLAEPELSIVLFRRVGWTDEDYRNWSVSRARDGVALVVPTTYRGETCMRICIVNPRTTMAMLMPLLDDMAASS
jgi:glutamate/tyrosine decarboxylase-like PLP-dependent enzyme